MPLDKSDYSKLIEYSKDKEEYKKKHKKSPDKFDKPSRTDRALYKVAQAHTRLKRRLKGKPKPTAKSTENVPKSQRSVLHRNLSQKQIDKFK